MVDVKCPMCGKMIMSIREVENLLHRTDSKVLLTHCRCGEAVEIRSPMRDVFKISTSSGKRIEEVIQGEKGHDENDSLHR